MAGWLIKSLGYGKFGIIDSEDPMSPPSVTAGITAPAYDTFTRIMQDQYNNDEEVRAFMEGSYDLGFQYIGLAPAGSLETDLVWDCVRCTWVNKSKTRYQFRQGIAWESRTLGW